MLKHPESRVRLEGERDNGTSERGCDCLLSQKAKRGSARNSPKNAFVGTYHGHAGEVIINTEDCMANTDTLIAELYSAFNQRNIDGALALMSESVIWPKASEGGRVIGKEEIRSYWSRQWKEFDPHVEPIEVIERGAGKIDVRVHQLVKSLDGNVLSDSEVWHSYTIADGLIERMDIEGSEAASEQSASSAFSHH